MKTTTLAIILAFYFSGAKAELGTWVQKKSLSFARSTHVGLSLKGKGYICGGASADGTNLKDLWEYDQSTNTWSQKADMPGVGRQDMSGFTIGDYAYFGQGLHAATTTFFYSFNRYDPSSNTWSAIADCPVLRRTATGFSIDSIGYFTCGIWDGVARYKDLYAYNPRTDQWTQKASLPQAALNRSFACVVSVNHKAYLTGGFEGQIMDDFYEYDPVNDTWTQKADFPGGPRSSVSGLAIGNYVLMGLGKDFSSTEHKDWYYYNPADNTWTPMNSYPADNNTNNATFVINGKGYVCGGASTAQNVRDYVYELSAPELGIRERNTVARNPLKPYMAYSSGIMVCNTFKGHFEVTVHDMAGKQVFTSKKVFEEESFETIDLSHLAAGQYVAHFTNAGLSRSIKVMIP